MRPQTIVERLDFVAKRIPGLKFTPPTQLKPGDDPGYGCFMSCDMFYIEIKVDQSHQTVKDVIISHGNSAEGISCPVLRKVLQDQDFETFAKHLTGLHSIYQINTSDKKVKQKAYPALTALEQDLTILYDHQRRRISNCHDIVHKSPLGIMNPRRGGLPVSLTYFITPYDLVDITQNNNINSTINHIIDKNLGLSATVEIEGSGPHKLQIKTLISTQQNSSLPAYAPFNAQNSEKLPAQFILKLSQPLAMLNSSINQIVNEINEPSTIKDYLTSITTNSKEPLINLIARQELDLNKGPFCRSLDMIKSSSSDDDSRNNSYKHVYSVKLLDQYHTYHILDYYLERQDSVYLTKIPFTHPTSIPNILRVLRQQALFNFVLGSCIRGSKNTSGNNPNNSNIFYDNASKSSLGSFNIFDVIPVSLNNLCISFEHPSKESLATLEIDIRELNCQVYALDKESVCSNEFATKVLQKCWSIPVTLRSVLKKCNERRLALLEDANRRRERELQELLTNETETSKGNSLGLKALKNRLTSNQFAIKQGSSGGLKLTVTKTKPASTNLATSNLTLSNLLSSTTTSTTSPSTSSYSATLPQSTSSPSSSSSLATAPTSSLLYTSTPSSSASQVISNSTSISSTVPQLSSTTNSNSSMISSSSSTRSEAANKILVLGNSTPSIKYTIPKISKSQQVSGSNHTTNTSKQSNQNRNSVSSSTHPLGRTTSNPLANANRPPLTSTNNDNHLLNRILSSGQAQPNMRQKVNHRIMATVQQQLQQQQQQLQQQQQIQQQPQIQQQQFRQQSLLPQFSLQQQALQRMISPNIAMAQLLSDSLQRPSPSVINAPPQFYMKQQQQPMFISDDINSAPTITTTTMTNPILAIPKSNSSSNNNNNNNGLETTISTPSSPTECSQVETVKPPPLIPIDSLDEPQATSPEVDHPDDASDRLSIVDMNENIADSNSVTSTATSDAI